MSQLCGRRVGPGQVSESMHAKVARLDHFGLAPIKLPVVQELSLESDRLRHGDLVLLPGATEEHGAHILSSHDGELDPQRVADWRGLEEVYAGADGKPLYRPEGKIFTLVCGLVSFVLFRFSDLPTQRASLHLDDQYLSAGVRVVSGGVVVAGRGGAGGCCEVLDQAVEAEVYGFVSELPSRTMAIEVKLARPVVACSCMPRIA